VPSGTEINPFDSKIEVSAPILEEEGMDIHRRFWK